MGKSSTEIGGGAGIRGGGEIGIQPDFTLLHEDEALADLLEDRDVMGGGIDRSPGHAPPAQLADNAKDRGLGGTCGTKGAQEVQAHESITLNPKEVAGVCRKRAGEAPSAIELLPILFVGRLWEWLPR